MVASLTPFALLFLAATMCCFAADVSSAGAGCPCHMCSRLSMPSLPRPQVTAPPPLAPHPAPPLTHLAPRFVAGAIPDAPSRTTEQLIAIIGALKGGPDYEAAYDEAMDAYAASHAALCNWRKDAFDALATRRADGTYEVQPLRDSSLNSSMEAMSKLDKQRLSSYGLPLSGSGKPAAASYYAHAKAAGEVATAEEWASQAD